MNHKMKLEILIAELGKVYRVIGSFNSGILYVFLFFERESQAVLQESSLNFIFVLVRLY